MSPRGALFFFAAGRTLSNGGRGGRVSRLSSRSLLNRSVESLSTSFIVNVCKKWSSALSAGAAKAWPAMSMHGKGGRNARLPRMGPGTYERVLSKKGRM